MTVLLVASATPSLKSGGGVRSYGVTAALARHDEVEVAYIAFGESRPAQQYEALRGVRTRPLRASRGPRRGLEYLRARMRGVPESIARGVSPELPSATRRVGSDVRIVADGPVVAAALLAVARSRAVIYLGHNFESGFRSDFGRGDMEAFERTVLRTFSESWLPTHADVDAAVALGGEGVYARYVPNVVDTSAIRPVAPARRATVLFVGDFTYQPNREGLGFLAHEVMPIVWERRPDVRVAVVGRGLAKPPADRRIEVLGFVKDLHEAYAAADIAVVPLLHGGGSPLKFVEGLAYGLPVVATAHAARLLEDGVSGVHFLAASDASEFARAVVLLLIERDRAAEIGAAGRCLAVQRYSIDALAAILAA